MGTRVFIGNLPYQISNDELTDELSRLGHIPTEVKVIVDRETGNGRGFAFAEFGTEAAANAAITELNGSAQIGGRTIKVDQASERPGRSGGGGGGGGGGRRPEVHHRRDDSESWREDRKKGRKGKW